MRRVVAILLVLCSCVCGGSVSAISHTSNDIAINIQKITDKYLNYNCSNAQDSVLSICIDAIKKASVESNYNNKLFAEYLYVNALCIKGNINEGVAVAERMYEEAKQFKYPLSMALAIQAIGATYMYSGQHNDADTTFQEAEQIMVENSIDTIWQLRLAVQQLHNYMNSDNVALMLVYINKAKQLIKALPESDKEIYNFYIGCYQAVSNIKTENVAAAANYVNNKLSTAPSDGCYARWRYYILTKYYNLIGDTYKAILYCDSSLVFIKNTGNMIYYKAAMKDKADLLEKSGRVDEACVVLLGINRMTDSLNGTNYVEKINSLHVTYWVDKLEIENISAHNRFLMMASIYAIIGLFMIAMLVVSVRRKNKQLVLSRQNLDLARGAAEDSIRLKSLFLSNMSHELRTPLNAIVGFSEILTSSDDIDSETKELCGDNIKQNSELLMRLINDVVDFSELKGENIKFSLEKCEMVALCENVITTVENIKQTRASVNFVTSIDNLVLLTDKERMQQVLINLLVNATKFTKEGAISLTLNIDTDNKMAVFAVEDTGCGIPLEKQAHIFERFEKLHENIQGTGLGLSICQLIVEQMGGKIWIDSGYVKGARFVFTHPLYNSAENLAS